MVLFGFLWFFSRLIFSSHRWGMMKISFPWWKPPPSNFDHDLHVVRIDFLCFLHVFRSCLWFFMVLFCFVFFGFSTVSFFHHIVGEWWNSRVLDENRLRPIFVTIWHVARIDFLCFLNVFRSCLWFSMVCLVFLVFQPSHFFITSLEDDENLVSLMKTASATQ